MTPRRASFILVALIWAAMIALTMGVFLAMTPEIS